ncbi:MAG TPA: arylamine N-acetyltransferase [Fimbriimonadaceae bacterium]|jgi:arylamine N-acetyltransferase
MSKGEPTFDLPAVKKRLEIKDTKPDLEGLQSVYKAWCLNVPFDNLFKTNALFRNPNQITPYVEEMQFFENYLTHGITGTCWPHGNAIFSLLEALDFNVTRGTASMFELGPANHATTLAHFEDGSTWIVDNAFLTMAPVRIDPQALSLNQVGLHYSEAELDGETIYIHGTNPPMSHIFFRLLDRDVSAETYAERWQTMSGEGPFNSGLSVRRNFEDSIITMRGCSLFKFDEKGLTHETLDADSIKHHLQNTMGISRQFVDIWCASGALEASLKPSGPPPELPVRIPPSKRTKS